MNYVVLVGIVMMGSVLTSYARARAECLIPKCKVGFLERPERIVLLIIGAFYFMDPVLWVIAVLANWTVIHRILYTRSVIRGNEKAKKEQSNSSTASIASLARTGIRRLLRVFFVDTRSFAFSYPTTLTPFGSLRSKVASFTGAFSCTSSKSINW